MVFEVLMPSVAIFLHLLILFIGKL